MGIIERMATKAMIATVRKSLPGASDEKLVAHYNKLLEAYRMTDDVHNQADLFKLQQDILKEIENRK